MIQELVEFGKRVTNGKNLALKEEPFAIDLVLNENGEFQQFIVGGKQRIETEVITAKKGKARFLLDKSEEVLGVGEKVENKHKLFLEKLESYRGVKSLEPVFKFYDDSNENGLRKAISSFDGIDKRSKGESITFMVGTTRLLKLKEVRDSIISRHHENEKKASNGKVCSICGTANSPVLDEPHGMVKKMPRAKKDTIPDKALISYNEKAFESYGLKGNLNSSICRDCARYYIEALNFLLSDGRDVPGEGKQKAHKEYNHRINISDTTAVLFWTRQDVEDISPLAVTDTPDALWVKSLFESVWSGNKDLGSTIETNMFYSCTLSSAAARIAVRDWTAISLDEYKKNLAEWFRDIEIKNKDGELTYSPLKLLINATQRDKKPGDKDASDTNSKTRIGSLIWNAIIKGSSYTLPLEVLQSILIRIWKGDYFSTERAALIKLIINRNTNKNMKATLDESNTSVAYLCGRLFAVIESMQWKAMGNVNSGVKERYFAAAALQPAYVLGQLLTKNVTIYQRKVGGYLANELNEIAGKISENGCFPQRFSAIEQGEFALGYYFQRNHKKKETDSNN